MHKKTILFLLSGSLLFADCYVDTKKQYPVNIEELPKIAIQCIKSAAVQAGCVKKEKNTYILQENTVCIFNGGQNGAGIFLHPDKKNRPNDITILVSENGLDTFANGFNIIPLESNK